jgi:hypothetical protein
MSTNMSHENRVRRSARRKGCLLRKSRSRDPQAKGYRLYVLVGDCRGNRLPGAQAPILAFARGEGMTLADAEEAVRRLFNQKRSLCLCLSS